MATTYSFQKGKYGGPTGSIFPFFRDLSTNSASDPQYSENIPAGFLRCRGQILSADQFPQLAAILGVGAQCLYRKEGTTLQEADDDGTGGTFQLPDLGSKYISAGTNSGTYSNLTVPQATSTSAIVTKAGITVVLSATDDEILFTYSGNFNLPSHNLTMSGQWTATGPSTTNSVTVDEGQILPHGHFATMAQLSNAAQGDCNTGGWKYNSRYWGACYRSASFGSQCGPVTLIPVGNSAEEIGVLAGTTHRHGNAGIKISSQSKSGSMAAINIPSASLSTTVKLNTGSTTKIDAISPMFILCEYLIKY